jgi:ATP-dependent Zn protease
MNSKAKIAIICALLLCVAGAFWMFNTTSRRSLTMLTYSQFLEKVSTGQVARVTVMGSNSGVTPAICRLKDGTVERTVLPPDYRDAIVAMQDKLVDIEIRDSSNRPLPLVMKAAPFLLLLGVWIFLVIRKFPNGPGLSWLGSAGN